MILVYPLDAIGVGDKKIQYLKSLKGDRQSFGGFRLQIPSSKHIHHKKLILSNQRSDKNKRLTMGLSPLQICSYFSISWAFPWNLPKFMIISLSWITLCMKWWVAPKLVRLSVNDNLSIRIAFYDRHAHVHRGHLIIHNVK